MLGAALSDRFSEGIVPVRALYRGWRAWPAVLAATGIAAVSISATPEASAVDRHTTVQRWRIVITIPGELTALAAPSQQEVWAFGDDGKSGSASVPIALRRSGSHWIRTPIPRGLTGGFACAASSSPSNVWAFTGWGLDQWPGTAAALRLAGGRWVVSGRFGVGQFKGIGFVTDCLVLGSKDVWVFGSTAVGPGAGTWHFNGKWALTPGPWFYGATASGSSASNVWAFGASATLTAVLARWNGRSWAQNRSFNRALPKFGSGVLVGPLGLTAVSPHSLYVSAITETHGTFSHFVLAWNGRSWSRVRNPAPGYRLPNAVSDGRGGWWTASYPSPGFGISFLLHEAAAA
jgi:hypothetical protein